jgi:CheY-like chemotaxis protein
MATVLIVDDSPSCRNAAANLLRAEGHQVVCADNAWRGLVIMESMAVDLLILDLLLPGLDGFGLLKDVRQNPKLANVPVVVTTALNENEELWRRGQPQVKKWMVKGIYSGQGLVEAVGEVIGAGRAITSAA